MRLIDADALKKQLCLDKFEAITHSPERRMVTFDEIAAFIDHYAPTIEPKRGEWEEIDNWWESNEEVYLFRCSECGAEMNSPIEPNFCPNCGADMRKEGE